MTKSPWARSAGLAFVATLLATSSAWAAVSDLAMIDALEARFQKAVEAKDLDGMMSVYAPDALVFDAVPPRQYAGAAAYRKDWQDTLATFKGPLKLTIADLKATVSGDLAYSHSIQTVSATDAKSGRPVNMTVRVTDVYRKTVGGWKIVHEHVSFPVDLDTGKADLQSRP